MGTNRDQVRIVKMNTAWDHKTVGSQKVVQNLIDEEISEHAQMKLIRIPAGVRGGYHYHNDSENIWIVLEGTFEAVVGDTKYLVRKGEVIFMPKVVPHRTGNDGSDGECLVIELYAPPSSGIDSHPADLPSVIRDA
jgi:mannose-6-phosphate isomerase-like protein (cupin superfamily)